MQRVMINFPPELLRQVDAAARKRRQSRSEFVRRTLAHAFRGRKQQSFENLLAEGYRETAEQSAALAGEAQLLQAAAAEGVWVWDE